MKTKMVLMFAAVAAMVNIAWSNRFGSNNVQTPWGLYLHGSETSGFRM